MAGWFLRVLVPLVSGLFCVSAEVVPFLEPGFFFDYDIKTQPVRIPVTEQCETIHMEWSRAAATGPNPVAPYFFQIFTSTFIVPFVISAGSNLTFDFDVPFAPGTLYQICMYDSLGTPGGCQDIYTMIPNSTVSNPSCDNVTFPEKTFIPTGTVENGPISQFGVINQCSDVSITPTNGTPPFTLTISPPLHPPYNLTSDSMDPIVWTVSLSRAMHFFMSLTSSEGFVWQNGPMLVGQSDNDDCLAPDAIPSSKANAKAAGAGVGGLLGGMFLAGVAWFFRDRYIRHRKQQSITPWIDNEKLDLPLQEQHLSPPATVNPFMYDTPRVATRMRSDSNFSTTVNAASASRQLSPISTSMRRLSPVYVMHRDAGQITSRSTGRSAEVVELPPTYVDRDRREDVFVRPLPEKPRIQEEDEEEEEGQGTSELQNSTN